jgi:hypothetical protein
LGDGYTSLDLQLICFWPNDEVDCEVPLGKVAAVITSKICYHCGSAIIDLVLLWYYITEMMVAGEVPVFFRFPLHNNTVVL